MHAYQASILVYIRYHVRRSQFGSNDRGTMVLEYCTVQGETYGTCTRLELKLRKRAGATSLSNTQSDASSRPGPRPHSYAIPIGSPKHAVLLRACRRVRPSAPIYEYKTTILQRCRILDGDLVAWRGKDKGHASDATHQRA